MKYSKLITKIGYSLNGKLEQLRNVHELRKTVVDDRRQCGSSESQKNALLKIDLLSLMSNNQLCN